MLRVREQIFNLCQWLTMVFAGCQMAHARDVHGAIHDRDERHGLWKAFPWPCRL